MWAVFSISTLVYAIDWQLSCILYFYFFSNILVLDRLKSLYDAHDRMSLRHILFIYCLCEWKNTGLFWKYSPVYHSNRFILKLVYLQFWCHCNIENGNGNFPIWKYHSCRTTHESQQTKQKKKKRHHCREQKILPIESFISSYHLYKRYIFLLLPLILLSSHNELN